MKRITPLKQLQEELQKLPPQPREDLLLALVAFLRFQQKTHLQAVIDHIYNSQLPPQPKKLNSFN